MTKTIAIALMFGAVCCARPNGAPAADPSASRPDAATSDATTVSLPRTGVVASRLPGDDGFHNKGIAWPEPRFIDNKNGTVTDLLTGLVWLEDPSAWAGPMKWTEALRACNNLATGAAGLTDGSTAGEWRLPNVLELQSLVDYSRYEPALPDGHPFSGVTADVHWTSTTRLDSPKLTYAEAVSDAVRAVNLRDGRLMHCEKPGAAFVWPVRSLRTGAGGDAVLATPPAYPLPRTGQTRSYEVGDDGYHQQGRPWPVPRFVDNDDGTVTDKLTGLVWLKSNKHTGGGNLQKALTVCNELADGKSGLADGSAAGDWRLPNVRELHSLVDHSQRDPAIPAGSPFVDVDVSSHWTSTPLGHKPDGGWRVGIRDGGTGYSSSVGHDSIWPVRDAR